MSLVSSIVDRFTRDKTQAEAKQQAAREISLEEFIQAGAEERDLLKDEEKSFTAMLERENLDVVGFKRQVAMRREYLLASAGLQACNEARITLRELGAAQTAEMAARKAEDDRRRIWDEQHEIKARAARNVLSGLDAAQQRLRNALPAGDQSAISNGRAAIRATQAAINTLHDQAVEAEELVSQLAEPTKPAVPVDHLATRRDPDERLQAEYRQRIELYEREVRDQQAQRDSLAAMRERLEQLQETLREQQASQDATERRLLLKA